MYLRNLKGPHSRNGYLCINKEHANLNLFERCVQTAVENTSNTEQAVPDMCLNLMCTLMNTMIVEMMNGKTHASINALYGYCYFHRWIIAILETYPQKLGQIQSNDTSVRMRDSWDANNVSCKLIMFHVFFL